MWIRKFLAISLLVGCKEDPNADLCHHYAKLTADCREDKSDSGDILEETAYNFCIKGMNPKNDGLFGPKFRAQVECSKPLKAGDCAGYRRCEEQP
jgi:hypothetical protein